VHGLSTSSHSSKTQHTPSHQVIKHMLLSIGSVCLSTPPFLSLTSPSSLPLLLRLPIASGQPENDKGQPQHRCPSCTSVVWPSILYEPGIFVVARGGDRDSRALLDRRVSGRNIAVVDEERKDTVLIGQRDCSRVGRCVMTA
jgi:hypothetical protein